MAQEKEVSKWISRPVGIAFVISGIALILAGATIAAGDVKIFKKR